jgi:hypothetical protein
LIVRLDGEVLIELPMPNGLGVQDQYEKIVSELRD